MGRSHTFTERVFKRYASTVARWPLVFILVPLALVGGLSLGILRLQIDSDPNLVWVPPASIVNAQKSYFDAAFDPFFRVNQLILALDGASYGGSAALSESGTTPARNLGAHAASQMVSNTVVRTLAPGVDPGGIMTRDYLLAVLNLTQALSSTPDSAGTVLDDVCYKPIAGRGCLIESPLDYFRSDPAVIVSVQKAGCPC